MKPHNTLWLKTYCPLKAHNAGLFISRGAAMHPTRVIDSHELIFVKQGELDMWEEDSVFHLEAGQTLHLFPGRQHGSTKPMPSNLKFYWIHFEIEANYNRYGHRHEDEYTPAIKVPQVACLPQPERLERLFRIFLDEQEIGALHPHAANLLTLLMLTEVMQSIEEKAAQPDHLNAVATWAHTFIRINFDRPITPSKVAEALGYNTDYLGRIYRKTYGCTLTEAIHRHRVKIACQYLLDSKLTISQIAQKCGYPDPDYFRRIFRHHMQISPGDYRNEFSRVHVNTH
ncbi:MAG: AraC family transcriptional regulator [Anaerolineae bacterium]|jgi:AraC-like DNA-binding protein|nr:MAG: AraC family transcriptional regulator [Anaerolineae bacterium]